VKKEITAIFVRCGDDQEVIARQQKRKAAGERQPTSQTLTGPASPRRLVCAPGVMTLP
jgi:hypothetical protein